MDIAHGRHGRHGRRADHRDSQHTTRHRTPPRQRTAPRMTAHHRDLRRVIPGPERARHRAPDDGTGDGDTNLAATHDRNSTAVDVDLSHSAIAS